MQCRVVEREDGQLAIAVKTDAPVFYLTLEAQGLHGEFEDNGFTLVPDEERVLSYFRQETRYFESRIGLCTSHPASASTYV